MKKEKLPKVRSLAVRLADKYNPKIYRDNGDLDSDYHHNQTVLAIKAALDEGDKARLALRDKGKQQ